jgi:hypothetical protein
MDRIIKMLEEMRVMDERIFIDKSLIKRGGLIDSPVPDTDSYLDRIIDLNEAISVLNHHSMQKPCAAKTHLERNLV